MPRVSPLSTARTARDTAIAALIAQHIAATGGPAAFAARHAIDINTAHRIADGRRPCPAGIVDEVIAAIEADPRASLTQRTLVTALRGATAHRWPVRDLPLETR